MSNSTNLLDTNPPTPSDGKIDKNSLWGWWRKTNEWQSDLHREAAYKSLDIPSTGMIKAKTTNVSGLGWKELLVVAIAGLGGAYMWVSNMTEQVLPAQDVADSEYDVLFYDQHGNLVPVPRLPSELGGQ